jgi:hypothetical protein
VSISYTARAQLITDNFLAASDLLAYADVLSGAIGTDIGIRPQIAIADGTGVYGAWQDFVPGTYNAQFFKARVLVYSYNLQVIAFLSNVIFAVDVPDRIDSYSRTTSASASTALAYTSPFNGGNGAASLPTIQATIVNAVAGDDVVISSPTLSGCNLDVYNAGSRVVRTVNIQVQGY